MTTNLNSTGTSTNTSLSSSENKLSRPFIKVFISDLSRCVFKQNGLYLFGQRLRMIWIQGIVTSVEDSDSIHVKDELSSFSGVIVKSCSTVPGGGIESWIKEGSYVQILGEVVPVDSVPYVRAVKIVDLTHNKVLQDSWALEVTELRNFQDQKIKFAN